MNHLTVRTKAKFLLLHLMGRNRYWSLSKALYSYQTALQVERTTRDLAAASQIVREDPSGIRLFETPVGPYWAPCSVDSKALGVILAEMQAGAYETDKVRVRPGDVVLDCGANIGVFAQHALQAGAATVICFEPYSQSVECLRRNLADHIASGRVKICSKGLWDRDGELQFTVDPNNAGGNSFVTQNKGASPGPILPVTTIDKAVREFGLSRVDFIKMDIEAAETRALAGAEWTLRNHRPRLSVAVEHTPNRIANTEAVISVVRKSLPDVSVEALLCYITDDVQLAPEVLVFRQTA